MLIYIIMPLTDDHKNDVGKKIMLQIAQALQEKKLTIPELTYICLYLLETIEKIKTEEELINLLTELAANWDIFNPLLLIERGQIGEVTMQQQAATVSKLLKEQKVDEAHQMLSYQNGTQSS